MSGKSTSVHQIKRVSTTTSSRTPISSQERSLLSPRESENNMITIYVRTSSGKTISIKCDKKRKAVSILDEVERRCTIPRSMTYLVLHGKVLNEKRTIEENNIGTETTIDVSLRFPGGIEKSELMDTLESEEDREKKRKLEETCEGK